MNERTLNLFRSEGLQFNFGDKKNEFRGTKAVLAAGLPRHALDHQHGG